jgi:hypothetical protein
MSVTGYTYNIQEKRSKHDDEVLVKAKPHSSHEIGCHLPEREREGKVSLPK